MKTEREQELGGSRLERAFFKVVVVSMDVCDTALKKTDVILVNKRDVIYVWSINEMPAPMTGVFLH